jgi:hypothetical protein
MSNGRGVRRGVPDAESATRYSFVRMTMRPSGGAVRLRMSSRGAGSRGASPRLSRTGEEVRVVEVDRVDVREVDEGVDVDRARLARRERPARSSSGEHELAILVLES